MEVGLIGCGGIAPVHINAYKRIDDIDVVALCDLNLERAKYMAEKYKIDNIYADYFNMIENHDLSLIDICTPINTHASIIRDVAKETSSIFVEKPLALTTDECDKILTAVNKYNTNLCTGHLQLFSPNIMKVKEKITNGDFNLFSLKTTQKESFQYLRDLEIAPPWNVSKKQGGILWEVCTHLVYIQLHFLPEITEVFALGGNTKYEVYDNFTVLLSTKGESFGLIELNWISKETDILYEFTDYNGNRIQYFRDYNYLMDKTHFPPHTIKNIVTNILLDEYRVINKWFQFAQCYFKKCKINPMYNIINRYIYSIKNNLESPVTPEDGRNTVHVLECIKESLKEKNPVKIELV